MGDASSVRLRHAVSGDLNDVAAILNYEITHTTASWKSVRWTLACAERWFADRIKADHPVIVAHAADRIAGYGSYGSFRAGEGYGKTVEHSVYVDRSYRRLGVGRALIKDLIRRAVSAGHRRMIGGISADQTASLALHASLGFEEVGRLPGVGEKFGRSLDLVLMMRRLDTPRPTT